MTPYLTSRGRWVLMLAVLLLMVGTFGALPAVFVVSHGLLAILGIGYLYAILRHGALESGRVRLIVTLGDHAHATGLYRGERGHFIVEMENPTRLVFPWVYAHPVLGAGVSTVESRSCLGSIGARMSARWTLAIEAQRAGKTAIHGLFVSTEGFAGLVRVMLYVPCGIALTVLPTRSAMVALMPELTRRRSQAAAGVHRARRPGSGYELRELRDYASGDSFRHIAWRSSARRGKLIVRQFEDERTVTSILAVDMSGTMRGGPKGQKFQHVLDISAHMLTAFGSRGDRIGLVSFDASVHGYLKPASGDLHTRAALMHLLSLNNPIRDGQTDATTDDIASAVARYLLVQERLDFRKADARKRKLIPAAGSDFADLGVDVDLLRRWIASRARDEVRDYERQMLSAGIDVGGEDVIRRFAGMRAIDLAYRVDMRFGSKDAGLASAIERASSASRDAMLIAVVTDLCGIIDLERTRKALALAAHRRHHVLFVVPFSPSYWRSDVTTMDPQMDPEVIRALHDAFALAERRERTRFIQELRSLGCLVFPIGPDSSLTEIVAKLDKARRAV